ncbi:MULTISPECIES: twin-arginine translocase TatA/TatE family subunit [Winogradskyella]|uniref:Sec-independent protein translocase protein TatA n=1 Tax=Winogradskyella vincentii TaxID=2877122 RepID=A0ABS7XVZ2_9FLAO|nr:MULTISPECIES: twin-arginine translocase TatA/TatE family subunit [Winogradskyella]MCA0151807.1 twin-arginine translocase TatA/TatE family subunit [Winogradskyella vincentii]RCT55409.1 twin-arginine translocase TatA/TatE family subunit [Winogradskyella sp. KYW1333]
MIHQTIFLFIGGTEIVFILFIVVLVFGADKLPEIARGMGKGMRTLRDATNDIKHEVTKSAKENNIVDTDVTKNINEELNKVKDDLEDFTGSLKRDN